MLDFIKEHWPWMTAAVIAITILGSGWYLYNDNLNKAVDVAIVECNETKVQEELAAEKERSKSLEVRAAELRVLLAERERELAERPPFIEKIRTVTVTLPDEKMSEGAAAALDLLNERATNVQ